jgi:hypothetical protein
MLPARTKTKRQPIIMKYALLIHESQEYFDRPKDAAVTAPGRAYGEALQAAGVFVGGAGLESPQTATTVSVRDGKRHVQDGPYAETKEFLGGFAIIDVPNLDAALEWAARHPPPVTPRSRSVRWQGRISLSEVKNLHDERIRDARRD